MNSATDIIRDEHREIARILHTLEDLAENEEVLARGIKSGLIASMLHYLRVFPYAIHHPKEEKALFPAVAAKDGKTLVAVMAALVKDHAIAYALLREIEVAMGQSGTAAGIARLKEAILKYIGHKRRHIEREEGEILPIAERILDAENCAALKKSFTAGAHSKTGKDMRSEFEALFHHGQKK